MSILPNWVSSSSTWARRYSAYLRTSRLRVFFRKAWSSRCGWQRSHRILGVVPVEQRVVEADPQALLAEGLDHGGQEVLAPRGLGGLVVGVRRVPQAEALVVLGGDHEVLHAGVLRRPGPGLGIVEVRVEVVEVLLVILVLGALVVLDPLVARGQGVEPPVDEHPEPILDEPPGVAALGCLLGHVLLLACVRRPDLRSPVVEIIPRSTPGVKWPEVPKLCIFHAGPQMTSGSRGSCDSHAKT